MEKKIPYPLIPSELDRRKGIFLIQENFKQLHNDMFFSIAKERMSMYARFVDDALIKKKNFIQERKLSYKSFVV